MTQAQPLRPLWTLLKRRDEFNEPQLPLLTVVSEYGVGVRDLSDGRSPSEDLSGYRVVRTGDLVVNKMWARFGAYGVAGEDGIISPAYWVLTPRAELVEPRFLHHLLRSPYYRAEIWRRSKDLPPNGFDLPWDQFRTIVIPVPPKTVQVTIADLLDREMARIDGLLTKQNHLLSLYSERIDTLIKQHIATSSALGLGSDRAVPLKRLLQKVVRPAEEGAPIVTAYRDGEVDARANRRAEGYTLASDESTYQGVKRGDAVLHGLDGFAGAIGTSRVDGCCSPVYHVCEAIGGNAAPYVARMVRILALDGYIGAHATSVRERAVDLRNWDLLGAVRVPLVSPHDQRGVVELIKKARPVKEATERIASLLGERRDAALAATMTNSQLVPEAA